MADKGIVSGRPIRERRATLTHSQPPRLDSSSLGSVRYPAAMLRRPRDQHRQWVIGERLPGICAYNDLERHPVHCRPN